MTTSNTSIDTSTTSTTESASVITRNCCPICGAEWSIQPYYDTQGWLCPECDFFIEVPVTATELPASTSTEES